MSDDMGTNYYLHLGKRTSQGTGKPHRFQWATPVNRDLIPGGTTVMDEYGREYEFRDWLVLVMDDEDDFEAIGQWFS